MIKEFHTHSGIVRVNTDDHTYTELVDMGHKDLADCAEALSTVEAYLLKQGASLTNKELTLTLRSLVCILGYLPIDTFTNPANLDPLELSDL